MTAFKRLWKRAPLWRASVLFTICALGLAAFYPVAALKRALPWLPGQATAPRYISQTGGPLAREGQEAPSEPIGFPDIGITESRSISIAGHVMPLPAGEWHPILTAQAGLHHEISEQVLARTDRGVVSGVIIVHATQQPVPQYVADNLETACHDDRNYAAQIANTAHMEECSYMENAVLSNQTISTDPLITTAFNRLVALGFPIPPLMINIGWYHAGHQDRNTVQIETVETLVAPIEQGSRQLLAPQQYWNKQTFHQNPEATRFINSLNRWMVKWSGTLRRGFDGTLDPATLVPPLIDDPSAPRPF